MNLQDLENSKLLQNEYLIAKIGVDTAENEPSKVSGGSEFHPAVSHTDPTPPPRQLAAPVTTGAGRTGHPAGQARGGGNEFDRTIASVCENSAIFINNAFRFHQQAP